MDWTPGRTEWVRDLPEAKFQVSKQVYFATINIFEKKY